MPKLPAEPQSTEPVVEEILEISRIARKIADDPKRSASDRRKALGTMGKCARALRPAAKPPSESAILVARSKASLRRKSSDAQEEHRRWVKEEARKQQLRKDEVVAITKRLISEFPEQCLADISPDRIAAVIENSMTRQVKPVRLVFSSPRETSGTPTLFVQHDYQGRRTETFVNVDLGERENRVCAREVAAITEGLISEFGDRSLSEIAPGVISGVVERSMMVLEPNAGVLSNSPSAIDDAKASGIPTRIDQHDDRGHRTEVFVNCDPAPRRRARPPQQEPVVEDAPKPPLNGGSWFEIRRVPDTGIKVPPELTLQEKIAYESTELLRRQQAKTQGDWVERKVRSNHGRPSDRGEW